MYYVRDTSVSRAFAALVNLLASEDVPPSAESRS